MIRTIASRAATTAVAGITALCFGFVSQVSAQSAVITTTGPDSTNIISSHDQIDCDVQNTNNVQAITTNNQSAESGDAVVSHNTNAGGSWSSWDPAVWKARGYSYEQWHSAFMSYMATQEADWVAGWNGTGSGGASTSGDATNTANTNVNVSIANGDGACGGQQAQTGQQASGSVNNTGPGSNNQILGSTTTRAATTNFNGILGATTNNQSATSRGVFGGFNTSMGGGASGGAGNMAGSGLGASVSNNPASGGGGDGNNSGSSPLPTSASISNTGPGSNNVIRFTNSSDTSVSNTNNISSITTNNQTANSGNTSTTHNTNAGGAASGNADNAASGGTGVDIRN
ncbi:MAG TPA: hypothetical protein VJP80_05050 [Candidatus Saccharimonadales bacterium]|nr:hypothetical protein [Candidatus Saccharimonadales bacterium]